MTVCCTLVYSSYSTAQNRRMRTLHALVDVCRVSVSFCRDSITPSSVQWQPCRQLLPCRRRRCRNLADDFSSHSGRHLWTCPTLACGLPLWGILSKSMISFIVLAFSIYFGFLLYKQYVWCTVLSDFVYIFCFINCICHVWAAGHLLRVTFNNGTSLQMINNLFEFWCFHADICHTCVVLIQS